MVSDAEANLALLEFANKMQSNIALAERKLQEIGLPRVTALGYAYMVDETTSTYNWFSQWTNVLVSDTRKGTRDEFMRELKQKLRYYSRGESDRIQWKGSNSLRDAITALVSRLER